MQHSTYRIELNKTVIQRGKKKQTTMKTKYQNE